MFVVELDEGAIALIAMNCGTWAAKAGADPFHSEGLDIAVLSAMQRWMYDLDRFVSEAQADGWRMACAGERLRADYTIVARDCM